MGKLDPNKIGGKIEMPTNRAYNRMGARYGCEVSDMIQIHDSAEEMGAEGGDAGRRIYCSFEGADMGVPELLRDSPQALALLHLLIEGYLACNDEERDSYWREATENTVQWMAKKGIIELV